MIGNWGNSSGFQPVKHARILNPDRHRVAREAFRVGNDQFVGGITKGVTQRLDFGLSRTAPCRRVCFVREEDGVWGHSVPVKAPTAFHVGDETVHDLADVFNVQARTMVSRIGRGRAEEFSNGLHAALLRFGVTFDDEGRCTHAQNEAVATAVKGKSGLFNDVVGRSSAGCGEATCNPLPEVVACYVIPADDDHTVNPSSVQPVFGNPEGSGGGSTGQIDGGVRPSNASVLGELGMAHVERLEQIPAIEASFAIIAVVLGMLGGHLKTWEAGGEDDARAFTLNLRHLPVSNQTKSALANLLNRRERNPCIA